MRAEVRAEAAGSSAGMEPPGWRSCSSVTTAASQVYVRNKTKAAAEAGLATFDHHARRRHDARTSCSSSSRELNADARVDGILVQLPLPQQHRQRRGDRARSTRRRTSTAFIRGTSAACGRASRRSCRARRAAACGCSPRRARAGGRRGRRARPLATSSASRWRCCCCNANATVTICHSQTARSAGRGAARRHRRRRDRQGRVGPRRLDQAGRDRHRRRHQPQRPTASCVGDVEFAAAAARARAITPVPGGVGPMTIAMLLREHRRAPPRRVRPLDQRAVAAVGRLRAGQPPSRAIFPARLACSGFGA